jgi:hypothetical protein
LDPKQLTTEELTAKVRAFYEKRPGFGDDEDSSMKLGTVEISTNSVRIATTSSYASLKELLSQNVYIWGPNALMFDDGRFEIDTNRNLRMTFNASPGASRFAKNMARSWKASRTKFEWKLVLPGKILASGLPITEGNSTAILIDAEKPDSMDAAIKLIGSPLVITAELAGLKLDEPLESKKRGGGARGKSKSVPDMPITDAAAGFVAEPVSVTLSSIHYFPEGEKYFKDRSESAMLGMSPTGTTISAKLFPPKGREIRSVTELRVKAAKDDQGRAIADSAAEESPPENYSEYMRFNADDSNANAKAAHVDLRLALPAPDAKTIEEIQAEAIAFTIGGWKDLVLTNIQADAKTEIDLAEILPGAKLTIKKVTGQAQQKMVEATLSGPAAVNLVDIKLKLNTTRGSTHMNEMRNTTTGGKTSRNVMVQGYEFDSSGGGGSESKKTPVNLIVRFPQDMKRERVQFKLTALDLL